MISNKHLAIVRAALTFWDEEMGASDREAYKHYLHTKDKEMEFSAKEIAEARNLFNSVELKTALVDIEHGTLVSQSPMEAVAEASYQVDREKLVIVLVPVN